VSKRIEHDLEKAKWQYELNKQKKIE